jgi:hypothetical protein
MFRLLHTTHGDCTNARLKSFRRSGNNGRIVACRQKVPHVASAERMEVMHRLHTFLLRQSDKLECAVKEQTKACEHIEGSEDSNEQPPVVSHTPEQVLL